jgi:hypothetical protein
MQSTRRHPGCRISANPHHRRGRSTAFDRQGKILALFAIVLPVLLAVGGLLLDGGELLNDHSMAQHAADAAASAAAKAVHDGADRSEAVAIAQDYVQRHNGLSGADVTVSIPPASGPFAGDAQSVEVEVRQASAGHFLSFLGGGQRPTVRARAVARAEPSTAGAALVVLDPDPPPIAVPAIGGILPPLPSLLGGLEIIGVSRIRVEGAIHVNTQWGGVDEKGALAGDSAPIPWGLACPGVLVSEKLRAQDIRVVGGIDDPDNYGPLTPGDPSPVRANSLPVPDPLAALPVPTLASDPINVANVLRGGMRIADLPLINPPRTLQPGVYDYLQIVSGNVTFAPGVYIIRGVDPLTGIALSLLGGSITADGVLFYITDSAAYAPASGAPDGGDGETVPPSPGVLTILPSTVINVLLPTSTFRGLDDPSSPFHGMLIYQRRRDRRPVALVNNLLLGGAQIDGVIYAKWGHVILVGSGFRETRVVAGTLRLLSVTPSLIAPTELLPPAVDVFLVE